MDKIILSEGCIADEFSYNDKSIYDLTTDELITLIDKVVDSIKTRKLKYEQYTDVLRELVYTVADYEVSDPCLQCGDCISTYTLEI